MTRSQLRRRRPLLESLEDRRLLAVTIHELPIPSTTGTVVAGTDGALWFPLKDNQLGRMSTAGELTKFDVGTRPTGGMAVSASGDIWFTTEGDQIGCYSSSTGVKLFDTPAGLTSSAPWRLAAGSDGNIWFTENTGNKIGRLTADGTVTEFEVPTKNSAPNDITRGPDGDVWFLEMIGDKIGRITPQGRITEFVIPHPAGSSIGGSASGQIVTGADGNLWFTDPSGSGSIGQITPDGQINKFKLPSQNGEPMGIAAGPDGNVWFTEVKNNQIGRITADGLVTEFTVPTAATMPAGIVAGSDGNIWFTELTQPNLGRLDLAYTDLRINLMAGPAPSTAGAALTYSITITNASAHDATNVTMRDPLDDLYSNSSVVSYTASQGTVVGPSLSTFTDYLEAHLGTLASGATATVTIVVRPLRAGSIANHATVQADESDAHAVDNVANVAMSVQTGSSTQPPPEGSGGLSPTRYLG